ncbi:hypothetical protein GH714_022861 [Hevea brasiliensis]|uniref:t-SNARE coiled-coil homology domain-containing protein n=1 Tax=Hevea brasiliensis TaxID=3981 RepID=A0A6A6NJ05_HEVBR|nr:hypothetical protein GH714_022861 [Hevea brasiliensis]
MATRNRTIQYRKHRDAVKSVRAPLSSSASVLGGPVIEMVNTSFLRSKRASYTPLSTEDPGPSGGDAFTIGLPPAWVDDTEEIAANIQIVRTKMAELVKAHAKALMPSFGDGKDDQRRIEALTREITDLLRKSEKRLQKLPASESPEDSNIRKNVQGHDGVDFQMNINENKSRYKDDEFSDTDFDQHQTIHLKKSEHLTEEREREIKQVVASVNELAQIMRDLSVLVIDQQGTIVDRIDYNIQNVASSVEEGFKQLQKHVCLSFPRIALDFYHAARDAILHYAISLYKLESLEDGRVFLNQS